MRKILISFLIATALYILSALPISAQNATNTAVLSGVLKSDFVEPDDRIQKLSAFLQNQNSPLATYSGEFIMAADTYGLDWKLAPAITGVESSFGKRIPFKSYNAYGWNNGKFKFQSWEESIWYVTKTLKEKYIDRGKISVQSIGRIYAPPSPFWAKRVGFFMGKIEKTPSFTLDL